MRISATRSSGGIAEDYHEGAVCPARQRAAVWDTSASGLPSAGVYHGRDGVRRFFRDWLAPWTDYSIEARECIEVGGAVVLVFRQAGTGKTSGARTERDFFGVWELEDSKVVRFRLFASREQALDAARLSE